MKKCPVTYCNIMNLVLGGVNLFFLFLFYFQSNRFIRVSGCDLSAVILTAVGVLVTVLGIVIALLALIGYKSIKDEATTMAREAVNATIKAIEKQATTVARDTAEAQVGKLLWEIERSRLYSSTDNENSNKASEPSDNELINSIDEK